MIVFVNHDNLQNSLNSPIRGIWKRIIWIISDRNLQKLISVTVLTQGTWNSNYYVGVFRLVYMIFFYRANRWAITYTYNQQTQRLIITNMYNYLYHHIPVKFLTHTQYVINIALSATRICGYLHSNNFFIV